MTHRTQQNAHAARTARRGFTIVELLISLTMALVILSSATAFAMTSWQSRRGWTLKESVDRNARFIGMAVGRDAAEAGIDIESTPVFGSLATFGDTISILSVPYDPLAAPTYRFDAMNNDTINPLPPGGNCGTYCLTFLKENGTYDIESGDLVRLQVNGERRLLMVASTSDLYRTSRSPSSRPRQSWAGRRGSVTRFASTDSAQRFRS